MKNYETFFIYKDKILGAVATVAPEFLPIGTEIDYYGVSFTVVKIKRILSKGLPQRINIYLEKLWRN